MHKLFGQLYYNLDNLIDISSLITLRPKISAFVANNIRHIKPVYYESRACYNPNNKLGILELENIFNLNPNSEYFDTITQCIEKNTFDFYTLFENQQVIEGGFNLKLRDPISMTNKAYFASCKQTEFDNEFTFFYNWLDSQNIFSDYGRVNFFINYQNTKTEIHKDIEYSSNWEQQDQFILINLFDAKRIFLLDENTNQKTFMNGKCIWFVGANYHGTELAEHTTYSLRVDGTFSKSFLNKINGRG